LQILSIGIESAGFNVFVSLGLCFFMQQSHPSPFEHAPISRTEPSICPWGYLSRSIHCCGLIRIKYMKLQRHWDPARCEARDSFCRWLLSWLSQSLTFFPGLIITKMQLAQSQNVNQLMPLRPFEARYWSAERSRPFGFEAIGALEVE
jgi:hypothetical protein